MRAWYDPRRVRELLASLVTDEATDELTAADAVGAYASLGATAGELELLKRRLVGKDRIRDMSPVELAFGKALLAVQKRDGKTPKPDVRDIQKRPPTRRPPGPVLPKAPLTPGKKNP